MTEKDKSLLELMRGMWRIVLLAMLGIGTAAWIVTGIDSEWAAWWMRIFFGGAAEWILERPVLKAVGKA